MGEEDINEYGDEVVSTTSHHGIDVASQRIDDLDRAALEYALNREEMAAIDIGCGLGHQGIRFAMLGLSTTLVDIMDIEDRIQAVSDLLFLEDKLEFLCIDARNLESINLADDLGLVFSQRFVHYLQYEEAKSVLSTIAEAMDQGRIYISASGLKTELGEGYPDADTPLQDRFAELEPSMAKKHEIEKPVCLYTSDNMCTLLEEAGFDIIDIYTSSFGNIKAVGEIT